MRRAVTSTVAAPLRQSRANGVLPGFGGCALLPSLQSFGAATAHVAAAVAAAAVAIPIAVASPVDSRCCPCCCADSVAAGGSRKLTAFDALSSTVATKVANRTSASSAGRSQSAVGGSAGPRGKRIASLPYDDRVQVAGRAAA